MKKKIWILFLALALALTACGQGDTAEPVPTVALDTGASDSDSPASVSGNTIIASAEVRPVDSVGLSFPLLGRVISVAVEVGDTVSRGQTVATLDTTIIKARIAEAEPSVVSAETEVRYLQRVGVGNAYERIDAAQANVDRAQAVVGSQRSHL